MRRLRTEKSVRWFPLFLLVVGVSIVQASEVNKDEEATKESVVTSKINGIIRRVIRGDLKNYPSKGLRKPMRTMEKPSEGPTILNNTHKRDQVSNSEDTLPSGLEESRVDKSDGNHHDKLEESSKDQQLQARGFDIGDYDLHEEDYYSAGCDPSHPCSCRYGHGDHDYGNAYDSQQSYDPRSDPGFDPFNAAPRPSSHSISMINDWDGGWNVHRRYFDPIDQNHYALNPRRLRMANADSIERQLRKLYGPNAMINVSVNGNRFTFDIVEDNSEYDYHPPWDPEFPPSLKRQRGWYESTDRMRTPQRGVIDLFRAGPPPKRLKSMGSASPSSMGRTSTRKNDFMIVDGRGMHSFMDPSDLIDTIEELNRDPSAFQVTFACEPKIGKYMCKAQCVKRGDGMTGTCETGFCQCIGRDEKKLRKKLGNKYRDVTEGFRHDCKNAAKRCKKYCKYLTVQKEFYGVCSDNNICKCVACPVPLNKNKKTVCAKAIKKLQKLENLTLQTLGYKGVNAPLKYGTPSPETEKIVRQLHASDQFRGCTVEEIRNLKDVIRRLSDAMNTLRETGDPMPMPDKATVN